MNISKDIINSVKETIGYSEATNKESFMIGANVAFKKSEIYYEGIIKTLTSQMEMYKQSSENVFNDIKTIVSIFNKYKD